MSDALERVRKAQKEIERQGCSSHWTEWAKAVVSWIEQHEVDRQPETTESQPVKLEVGKKYDRRDDDGWVEIVNIDTTAEPGDQAIGRHLDGRPWIGQIDGVYCEGDVSDADLIREHVEPTPVLVRWFNVYAEAVTLHKSKDYADMQANSDRLSRIRVEFPAGRWDE